MSPCVPSINYSPAWEDQDAINGVLQHISVYIYLFGL